MTLRLEAVALLTTLLALPVTSVHAQMLKERMTAEFAISVPAHWAQRPPNISVFAPMIAANRELFPGMDANAIGRLVESLNIFIAEDPTAPSSIAVNRAPLGIDGEVAQLERSPEVHSMSRRRMVLPAGQALEHKWSTALATPSGQRVAFTYTDYYLQSPWRATYVLHFGSSKDRGDADAPLFDRIAASFRWIGPERFAVLGFSILAPGGDGWIPLKRSVDQIQFLKLFIRHGSEPHTVTVLASAGDIRPLTFATPVELAAAVKNDLEPGQSRLRNAVSSVESVTTPASLCVRYRVVMEDLGVPGFVGTVFITTRFGLRCVHPEVPGLVMDIVCSQRALRGREQLNVDAEVARLLDSVVFTTVRP